MSKNILLQAHDAIYIMVKNVKEEMNEFIEREQYHSTITGELITGWDQMLKEMEAIENEIKKDIKLGATDMDETDYFVIRKTTTYEYDPEKLREVYPDAGFFITTKESVKKAELDKAIKDKMAPEEAKEALREKSTSISFIDKAKIQDRQEKTVEV